MIIIILYPLSKPNKNIHFFLIKGDPVLMCAPINS